MTKAVWKPRLRILYTLLLSAIIIYWFGIIAYVCFSSDFENVVKGSSLTLRRIIAVIFNSWHSSGFGSFFNENEGSAFYKEVGDGDDKENIYNFKSGRTVYDFLLFFLLSTLLLSILGGIVVEHFFQTRSRSDNIIEAKKFKCFICGKPSIDIPEFKKHCKFTHNIWDYMYYISFVKEMEEGDRKDYRDIQVYNSLQNKNYFWLPAFKDDARSIINTQKARDILGEVIPNYLDQAEHD